MQTAGAGLGSFDFSQVVSGLQREKEKCGRLLDRKSVLEQQAPNEGVTPGSPLAGIRRVTQTHLSRLGLWDGRQPERPLLWTGVSGQRPLVSPPVFAVNACVCSHAGIFLTPWSCSERWRSRLRALCSKCSLLLIVALWLPSVPRKSVFQIFLVVLMKSRRVPVRYSPPLVKRAWFRIGL